MSEQITVLRKLWSEPYVTFEGRWHKLDRVGLNRVVEPPIPIWIGAHGDERALRRVARLADGFIPLGDPSEPMARIRQLMAEYGRDPASIALNGRVAAGAADMVDAARALAAQGATHLTIAPPQGAAGAQALDAIIAAKRSLEQAL
jgi:alkanesulfonate monooxygenase SsuD/methylene tetrahydromethanopterin reductase-like flavin-dependent oxidoreductase (luciferase family)